MKDLYAILQLAETATPTEIKQAYRKLARTYHPDRLSQAASGERMRELNEAYAVLSNAEKRQRYDYLRRLAYEPEEIIVTPPPRQRRQPPPAAFRQAGRPSERELVKPYLPAMEKLLIVVLLFAALLLTDYLLPPQQSPVTIEYVREQVRFSNTGERFVTIFVKTDHSRFKTTETTGKLFVGKETAILEHSSLLQQPLRLFPYHHAANFIRTRKSLYANFAFFPILMTLLALLGLKKNSAPEHRFGWGVASLFLAVITLILL